MEPLPTASEINDDLNAAAAAGLAAPQLRRRLRRRLPRGDPERQKQLAACVSDLEIHGGVLRSHLKRSDHHSPPFTPYSVAHRRRIKKLLRVLRYERRQLSKMLP